MVKNSPADAGDAGDSRDWGSMLGWEDTPKEEIAPLSSILACKISLTKETGGLQAMESKSQTRLSRLACAQGSQLPMLPGGHLIS